MPLSISSSSLPFPPPLLPSSLPFPPPLLPTHRGSQDLHLALLHPRELAVHTLTSHQSEEGVQHTLTLVYHHALQRTAANMTWGPFGAAEGPLTYDTTFYLVFPLSSFDCYKNWTVGKPGNKSNHFTVGRS